MPSGVSPEEPSVRVRWISGDTPAELFSAAAQWAAEQDGGFAIEALTWSRSSSGFDDFKYEMGVYYEPQ